ncbi:hypothetical protein LJR066_005851 [Acidovorax sp. LjRoot66]|uniref:hypothetical protein n=1 Tax=Acidovorax sp. LjRoot66 TaxID=3342334 RepID=UPI003ECE9C9C
MKLQEHQALAILAMAEHRNEYNFGVFAMLGKFDLAVDYGAACRAVDATCSALQDALGAAGRHDMAFREAMEHPSALGVKIVELVASCEAASERRASIWAEIEELKEQYRDVGAQAIRNWIP